MTRLTLPQTLLLEVWQQHRLTTPHDWEWTLSLVPDGHRARPIADRDPTRTHHIESGRAPTQHAALTAGRTALLDHDALHRILPWL